MFSKKSTHCSWPLLCSCQRQEKTTSKFPQTRLRALGHWASSDLNLQRSNRRPLDASSHTLGQVFTHFDCSKPASHMHQVSIPSVFPEQLNPL